MIIFYILIGIIIIIIATLHFKGSHLSRSIKTVYLYKPKKFFLTKPEHQCHDTLTHAIGEKYYIFPQVHLSHIFDHKIRGQSWRGAFAHIHQKSIDYLLCDKNYISPILGIELDDSTHNKPSRRKRDQEVERIFTQTGIPLLRLKNHECANPDILRKKINDVLKDHE